MRPEQYWKQPEQLALLAEIGPVEWEGEESRQQLRYNTKPYMGHSWERCDWIDIGLIARSAVDDYTAVAIIRRWLIDKLESWEVPLFNALSQNTQLGSIEFDRWLVSGVKHHLRRKQGTKVV